VQRETRREKAWTTFELADMGKRKNINLCKKRLRTLETTIFKKDEKKNQRLKTKKIQAGEESEATTPKSGLTHNHQETIKILRWQSGFGH